MEQNEKPDPADASLGVKWASQVLDLDVAAATGHNELKAAALDSFFRRLQSTGFTKDDESSEAVEVIFGKSPQTCSSFRESFENENLDAIDQIVHWYASQLGMIDRETLRDELRNRLGPLTSQLSAAEIRQYAQQVQQAATVTNVPPGDSNELARQLAQAVFQISAIRNSKRRDLRTRLVRRFQSQHPGSELAEAVRHVCSKYQIPNKVFHQPFLSQIQWTEAQVDDFRLWEPVSATTRSTVVYSQHYGDTATNRSYQTPRTGFSWGWILVAVLACGIIPALSRLNSTTHKPPLNNLNLDRVPVIVFDKNNPSNYSVDFVAEVDAFGRMRQITESPEHPGPLTYVPLSQIEVREEAYLDPSERDEVMEGLLNLLNPDGRQDGSEHD